MVIQTSMKYQVICSAIKSSALLLNNRPFTPAMGAKAQMFIQSVPLTLSLLSLALKNYNLPRSLDAAKKLALTRQQANRFNLQFKACNRKHVFWSNKTSVLTWTLDSGFCASWDKSEKLMAYGLRQSHLHKDAFKHCNTNWNSYFR